MAFPSIKWPLQIATHVRKFATITNLKDKKFGIAVGGTLSSTASQFMAHNGTSVTPVAGYFGAPLSLNAAPSNAIVLTAQQSGGMILGDIATGGTVTLPAPQAGLWYQFVVTVTVTSNNYKIVTNNPGTVLLIGSLWETVAAGTGTSFFPNGTTHSACTMAGTTSGGLINTAIDVYCVNATTWLIDGTNMASGTIVTPFTNS